MLKYANSMGKFCTVAFGVLLPFACAAQAPSPARPIPRFEDVTKEAGLSVPHLSTPEKRYIIESMSGGVGFIDCDNDGRLDIITVNGSSVDRYRQGGDLMITLYHQDSNLKFTDITNAAGLTRKGWGMGVAVADFDNDGWQDIYVTGYGGNVLYRNLGNCKFEDVTDKAGVRVGGFSTGASWADYDRDGHVDLFVPRYVYVDINKLPEFGSNDKTCRFRGIPVQCGPWGLLGESDFLFRNRGDGTFEDVTRKSRIGEAKGFYAFTAVAADLNGDGWTDIYVASDSTPSLFFRNNKDGTFSELGAESGLAFNEHGFEQGGMGVGVGDFDGDGLLDLIKTNFAGDHPNLFRNLGKGIFEDVVLKAGLAVNPQYVAWGVALADLDNDGWQDVLQVNGHVYPELARSKLAERYLNPRIVYRNLGGGRFEDVSALAGPGIAEKKSSRGAAFGDFDNDGDIDVVIMNMGEAPSLLRNDLKPGRHWIQLKLEGRKSNRSAIGATVTIEAGGRRQTLPVLSQSSFLSQNDGRLHFGLDRASRVEKIRVAWPNGNLEEFPGAAADRRYVLVEGSAEVKPWSR